MAAFLKKAIEFIDGQLLAEQNAVNSPLKQKAIRLKWSGTTMDYVEWVYALYGTLTLNGEKAKLKTLFDVFNPVFGFEDFQFSSYYSRIRSRKKGDRTTFLDLQKQRFIRQMEKADNKQGKTTR